MREEGIEAWYKLIQEIESGKDYTYEEAFEMVSKYPAREYLPGYFSFVRNIRNVGWETLFGVESSESYEPNSRRHNDQTVTLKNKDNEDRVLCFPGYTAR